jgi:hypothetical protein
MENRPERRLMEGGKEEEGRARGSEPYSPSRATTPHTEDDMDVDLLDYEEDEADESGEESLLTDLLEEEDDWSRNLSGVKEMLNPDGGDPQGAAVGAAPPAVVNNDEGQPREEVPGNGAHVSIVTAEAVVENRGYVTAS